MGRVFIAHLRLVWFAIWLLYSAPTTAHAQAVEDHIRVASAPDWVVPVSIPDTDPSEDAGRESVSLLVDTQRRIGRTTQETFHRYVMDLNAPAAVEDQGNISIDFDPAYEMISLYNISIERDGQRFNAIDLSEAMVFRTETQRDQMIFNGMLSFSMPVLDLRVGDRLSVSYGRSGRNPAIGEEFFLRHMFASTWDMKRRFIRILIDDDLYVHTRSINGVTEPEITTAGGWRIYQWDASDPQAPDYDGDAPAWAYLRPTFELSSFESWAEVGNLFEPYYRVGPDDRSAVADIVDAIQTEHDDPALQARAALDWVQTNIRYVGLELGESGFVPRPPARVLRRRFGDCKDVTLLLLTLFDAMGVEADPLLVDLNERGGELKGLPSPYAFDHIMVLAEIDGSLYPLDATRDPQTGTLDTLEKGDIAFGLRLIDGASTITKLPESDYEFREIVTETFDLVSEPGAVLYSLVFEEYGEDADATLAWIASSGEDDVLDGFKRYLADIYPTLEVTAPMTWESDEAAAMTRMHFEFRLPGYGEGERTALDTRTYQILGAMPSFEGGTRKAPFSIDHPRRVRHVRTYIGDESYTFVENSRTVETDAFQFKLSDTVEGHTLTEDYRWVSKSDHIKAEDFVDAMESIDTIRDLNYTEITLAEVAGESDASASASSGASLWLAWLILIGLPAGVVWFMVRPRRAN